MLKNTLGNKLNRRSRKFKMHFASFMIGEHIILVLGGQFETCKQYHHLNMH